MKDLTGHRATLLVVNPLFDPVFLLLFLIKCVPVVDHISAFCVELESNLSWVLVWSC